jgi:hypothetical protein
MTLTRTSVGELLHGCVPGRLQSVGAMQLLPLRADHDARADAAFAAPTAAHVGTAGYGNLVVRNPDALPLLLPAGATYIVAEAAQNHALPHTGFVAAGQRKTFPTAVCVQQGQGGMIREGNHPLMLLPLPLREEAHRVRREQNFGRLWQAIATFNDAAGLPAEKRVGHLEHFFDHYRGQLDTFAAQFEPTAGAVGCVVLLNGRVVGVELAPSPGYFAAVWRPLVRECYGGLALTESKADAPPTRVPLRPVASRLDLIEALREAAAAEQRLAGEALEKVLPLPLDRTADESDEVAVEAVGDHPFVGQVVRVGGRVVYASLVATKRWRESA